LQNNGSILGEKISLGIFKNDFNWLEAVATAANNNNNNNTFNYPVTAAGILYHEQYFETGSLCELNEKPRRSVAKIFCDESSTTYNGNSIDLISEIETCVYEIHINSRSICKIPYFNKKQNSFNINCSPVVEPKEYAKYLSDLESVEQQLSSTPTTSDLQEEKTVDLDKNDATSLLLNKLSEMTGGENQGDISMNYDILTKKIINLVDELTSKTGEIDENNNLLQVKTTKIASKEEIDNLLKNLEGDLETTDNTNTLLSNLEEKITEELSKQDDFKANKFKIKIIKFDPNKPLDINDYSNDLNSIISSLLDEEDQSQAKKYKQLKDNYNYVYGSRSEKYSDTTDDDTNEVDENKIILF